MTLLDRIVASIPSWQWGAISLLILIFLVMFGRLWWKTRQLTNRLAAFSALLPASQAGPYAQAMSRKEFEAIKTCVNEAKPGVQGWWQSIERSLQTYQGRAPKEGLYLTRPAREILPEEEVVAVAYHSNFYRAVPGILTSLGLTFTFVAILLGLAGLTVLDAGEGAKVVLGLDGLINNLSGKFLSSIVALVLAVFFTGFEKARESSVDRAYEQMLSRVSDTFPMLTAAQILVDIQVSGAERERALKNISSEVVDGFKHAFTEEINTSLSATLVQDLAMNLQPTLDTMTATLETLNASIVRLEAQKQETVLRDLTTMMNAMHQNVVDSLQTLGRDFSSGLSTAAEQERERIQQSLSASSELMERMTSQVEKLQDGFGSNIQNQITQVTQVVELLGSQMHQMGAKMVESMGSAQVAVAEQGKASLGELSSFTGKASKDIQSLLADLTSAANDIRQAGLNLGDMQSSWRSIFQASQSHAKQLQEAGTDLADTLNSYRDSLVLVKEIAKAQGQSIQQLTGTTDSMKTLQQGSASLVREYQSTIGGIQTRLQTLDQELSKVFEAVYQGMKAWTSSVDDAMKKLTVHTNEQLANVSKSLYGNIEELNQKLEELNEAFDRVLAERNS